MDPRVLARVRNVPTRLGAALLTFGGMLGVPAFFVFAGAILGALDFDVGAAVMGVFATICFIGFVIAAWILIFSARSRIKRAEVALYQGDFESATRDAHFVVRTVFRSDYQMGALFVLALAAERIGAFVDGGILFTRALGMIPAMAAQRPGRRARALFSAHAALDFAAAGDLMRANEMLARCHRELGATGQPGALEGLFDDSYMGAIGINSMLVELENRREPRPLGVLASMLVAFKHGQIQQVLQMMQYERPSIEFGLAPNERALADRLHQESLRLSSGAGPHRTPGEMQGAINPWAQMVVP